MGMLRARLVVATVLVAAALGTAVGTSEAAAPGPVRHDGGAATSDVDCSKFSDERTRPECEERANAGVGIMVVGGAVLTLVGFGVWLVLRRRVAARSAAPPSEE